MTQQESDAAPGLGCCCELLVLSIQSVCGSWATPVSDTHSRHGLNAGSLQVLTRHQWGMGVQGWTNRTSPPGVGLPLTHIARSIFNKVCMFDTQGLAQSTPKSCFILSWLEKANFHSKNVKISKLLFETIMLKLKVIVAGSVLILGTAAQAACYGSGTSYTCNDASGNSYNVQKYGNTTNMQGYNAGTGSNWTQNSQTYGNTTQIQGQANGRT